MELVVMSDSSDHRLRFSLALGITLLAALSASNAIGAGLWSEAVLVGEDDDYDCVAPGVALSADGTAFAIWSVLDPEEMDDEIVYVTISDTGQSEQMLLHAPNTGMDRVPFVSAGSDGVPWVIWERYGDGYEQVVSRWDGAAWTPPETVFSQGGRYDWYSIYAASSDDVLVTRDARAPGRSDRDVFVRHWDGHSWSEVEQIGFQDENDQDSVVALDPGGRAFVAWVSDFPPGEPPRIYAAVRDTDGWSTPAVVDTSPGNISMGDMELLPDGRPIVVWTGNGYTTSTDIEYAVLEDWGWDYGGLVNEPDVPGVDDDKKARLARSGSGDLWAIWDAGLSGTGIRGVHASRWRGNAWSREELVSVADATHLTTDDTGGVAVSEDGTVWAVWKRMQEEFPWDDDVYMAIREVPTAEGVYGLSAQASGSAVIVAWHVSGAWADSGFHVWRVAGTSAVAGTTPGSIPADATRITEHPVGGCSDCSFIDSSANTQGTYWYWIGGQREGPVLGPAKAVIHGGGDSETAGITGVRPNPTSEGVYLDISLSGDTRASLGIYTSDGRLLRRWPIGGTASSVHATQVIFWDGTDSAGRRLPSGIYFAALVEEGRSLSGSVRTIVILR
ncbi:MAG: hypothetical protein ABIK85_03465 [Candidatus Eisenbacteria bacterium]